MDLRGRIQIKNGIEQNKYEQGNRYDPSRPFCPLQYYAITAVETCVNYYFYAQWCKMPGAKTQALHCIS